MRTKSAAFAAARAVVSECGGGVDDAEVRAVFLGGIDDFCKTASVRGDDDRGLLVAVIVPTLSACLWVEVYKRRSENRRTPTHQPG